MKAKELIQELQKYDHEMPVVFGNLNEENEDGNAVMYMALSVEPLETENQDGKIQVIAICG